MKKINIMLFFLCLAEISFAQKINFRKFSYWSEIVKQAQKERKFIFIDVYASWCAPCKKMDEEVYTDVSVAEFMNEKFVSLKIQFDQIKSDSTKKAIELVNRINQHSKILSFPTLLFFNSNGHIVQRDEGFYNIPEFKRIVATALKADEGYYEKLETFLKGKKDFGQIPEMIAKSKELGDNTTEEMLIKAYMNSYLAKLPKNKLLKKENIIFINTNYLYIGSTLRQSIYREMDKVDLIMGKNGYVATLLEAALIKDFSKTSYLKDVDWRKKLDSLKILYPKLNVQKIVSKGKIEWYRKNEDWFQLARARIDDWQKNGMDTLGLVSAAHINTIAYTQVFKKISEPKTLLIFAGYVKSIINHYPVDEKQPNSFSVNIVDTYANLLYRAGMVKEAVFWQEKVVFWMPSDQSFRSNLAKMKKGLPTWS